MPLGPVMLDLEGPALSAGERELLRHPNVGGLVLFERNYESPAQLDELVTAIHDVREPRLLVAVDHEGGRGQRFDAGFTPLPPMARLGERYDEAPHEAQRAAEQLGWLLAAELLAHGVDLAFAPVLDLGRGISAAVGERALHNDPEVVALLGGAIMRGMRRAGMAAVAKHFPGRGSVAEDSDHGPPADARDRVDIRQLDAVPFERLAHKGLPAVMTAHVVYPAVDDRPVAFSPVWLEEILRAELGFSGAVIGADLSMAAAADSGDWAGRAGAAIAAGCDMVLVCNDRRGAAAVVEGLPRSDRPASFARLIRLHGDPAAGVGPGLADGAEWRAARAAVEALAGDPPPSRDGA